MDFLKPLRDRFDQATDAFFKRLYKYVLKKCIGPFLEDNLQLDQLQVSLRKGHLTLCNLKIQISTLNHFLKGQKIRVRKGFIKELSVQISYSDIMNESIVVKIKDIDIEITPWNEKEDKPLRQDHHYHYQQSQSQSQTYSSNSHNHSNQQQQQQQQQPPPTEFKLPYELHEEDDGHQILAQWIEQIVQKVKVDMSNVNVSILDCNLHIPHAVYQDETPDNYYGYGSGNSMMMNSSTMMQSSYHFSMAQSNAFFSGGLFVLKKAITIKKFEIEFNNNNHNNVIDTDDHVDKIKIMKSNLGCKIDIRLGKSNCNETMKIDTQIDIKDLYVYLSPWLINNMNDFFKLLSMDDNNFNDNDHDNDSNFDHTNNNNNIYESKTFEQEDTNNNNNNNNTDNDIIDGDQEINFRKIEEFIRLYSQNKEAAMGMSIAQLNQSMGEGESEFFDACEDEDDHDHGNSNSNSNSSNTQQQQKKNDKRKAINIKEVSFRMRLHLLTATATIFYDHNDLIDFQRKAFYNSSLSIDGNGNNIMNRNDLVLKYNHLNIHTKKGFHLVTKVAPEKTKMDITVSHFEINDNISDGNHIIECYKLVHFFIPDNGTMITPPPHITGNILSYNLNNNDDDDHDEKKSVRFGSSASTSTSTTARKNFRKPPLNCKDRNNNDNNNINSSNNNNNNSSTYEKEYEAHFSCQEIVSHFPFQTIKRLESIFSGRGKEDKRKEEQQKASSFSSASDNNNKSNSSTPPSIFGTVSVLFPVASVTILCDIGDPEDTPAFHMLTSCIPVQMGIGETEAKRWQDIPRGSIQHGTHGLNILAKKMVLEMKSEPSHREPTILKKTQNLKMDTISIGIIVKKSIDENEQIQVTEEEMNKSTNRYRRQKQTNHNSHNVTNKRTRGPQYSYLEFLRGFEYGGSKPFVEFFDNSNHQNDFPQSLNYLYDSHKTQYKVRFESLNEKDVTPELQAEERELPEMGDKLIHLCVPDMSIDLTKAEFVGMIEFVTAIVNNASNDNFNNNDNFEDNGTVGDRQKETKCHIEEQVFTKNQMPVPFLLTSKLCTLALYDILRPDLESDHQSETSYALTFVLEEFSLFSAMRSNIENDLRITCGDCTIFEWDDDANFENNAKKSHSQHRYNILSKSDKEDDPTKKLSLIPVLYRTKWIDNVKEANMRSMICIDFIKKLTHTGDKFHAFYIDFREISLRYNIESVWLLKIVRFFGSSPDDFPEELKNSVHLLAPDEKPKQVSRIFLAAYDSTIDYCAENTRAIFNFGLLRLSSNIVSGAKVQGYKIVLNDLVLYINNTPTSYHYENSALCGNYLLDFHDDVHEFGLLEPAPSVQRFLEQDGFVRVMTLSSLDAFIMNQVSDVEPPVNVELYVGILHLYTCTDSFEILQHIANEWWLDFQEFHAKSNIEVVVKEEEDKMMPENAGTNMFDSIDEETFVPTRAVKEKNKGEEKASAPSDINMGENKPDEFFSNFYDDHNSIADTNNSNNNNDNNLLPDSTSGLNINDGINDAMDDTANNQQPTADLSGRVNMDIKDYYPLAQESTIKKNDELRDQEYMVGWFPKDIDLEKSMTFEAIDDSSDDDSSNGGGMMARSMLSMGHRQISKDGDDEKIIDDNNSDSDSSDSSTFLSEEMEGLLNTKQAITSEREMYDLHCSQFMDMEALIPKPDDVQNTTLFGEKDDNVIAAGGEASYESDFESEEEGKNIGLQMNQSMILDDTPNMEMNGSIMMSKTNFCDRGGNASFGSLLGGSSSSEEDTGESLMMKSQMNSGFDERNLQDSQEAIGQDFGVKSMEYTWVNQVSQPEEQRARWFHNQDSISEGDYQQGKEEIRAGENKEDALKIFPNHIPLPKANWSPSYMGASASFENNKGPFNLAHIKMRLIVYDFSITWRLFGGTDWASNDTTRKTSTDSTGNRNSESGENERSKRLNQLFQDDSIDSSPRKSGDLFSSNKSPGDFERRRRKQYRNRRQSDKMVELTFAHISVLTNVFKPDIEDSQMLSSVVLTIKDFYFSDRTSTSLQRKVVNYWKNNRVHPREMHQNMLNFELTCVKGLDGVIMGKKIDSPLDEYRIRARFLPLRCHIDQATIQFLITFFSTGTGNVYPKRKPIHPTPDMFFQSCDIRPMKVKLNYEPQQLDYRAIQQGNYAELVNLFPMSGVELMLKKISLRGITGWGDLGEGILKSWVSDITSSQLHKFLTGAPTIRSVANVGNGFADLVLIPLEEYNNADGNIMRGIKKGAIRCVKGVTLETLNVSHKFTKLVATTLEELLPADSSSHLHRRINGGDPVQQPRGVLDTLDYGYETITKRTGSAVQMVIAIPLQEVGRRGPTAGMKAAIKALPVAVFKPLQGVTEALSYGLLGARNNLDSNMREEEEDQWKIS